MALGATTAMNRVRVPLGAIVYHHKQGYRGVIFGVDAEFALSDEWYDRVAQSRPPKDAPWYHVLVHGSSKTTYVAERNLVPAADRGPIEHPLLDTFFTHLVHSFGNDIANGRIAIGRDTADLSNGC